MDEAASDLDISLATLDRSLSVPSRYRRDRRVEGNGCVSADESPEEVAGRRDRSVYASYQKMMMQPRRVMKNGGFE